MAGWISSSNLKAALLLGEEPDRNAVQKVLDDGYQVQDPKFDDNELQKIGRDAFLVAYGFVAKENRVIVTRAVSKRTRRLGASKLPDVCEDCGVSWTTDYEMYRLLDFNLRG